MKAVIQRVLNSSVTVGGETVGKIEKGCLVLLGVMDGDTEKEAKLMADKVSSLRIFEDENEKMNLSVKDVDGEILAVSQFTLCADVHKGNRPSFTPSAAPETAKNLYIYFMEMLKENGIKKVEHGIFGADMKVSILNDGPCTILFNTDEWARGKKQ